MSEYAEAMKQAGIFFETEKRDLKQLIGRWRLVLDVQSGDLPQEICADDIGQRYMIMLIPIDDQEYPEVSSAKRHAQKLINQAGLLCRESEFQNYLFQNKIMKEWKPDSLEDDSASALREYLNIESRAELKTNKKAQERFEDMVADFDYWRNATR
jgi:hypothetical protein